MGPIVIKDRPIAYLRRRRKTLLKQLPPLDAILRGTLVERYKRCGKPGCKCARGAGHGPKYYLSVSKPGTRPEMDYVPLAYHDQVTHFLDNNRKARKILEEICEINRKLIHRKQRL